MGPDLTERTGAELLDRDDPNAIERASSQAEMVWT